MTIKESLTWARGILEGTSSTGALDARLLLQNTLEKDAAFIIANPEISITPPQLTHFKSLIDRRTRGEPVSKIIGLREFYGRTFHITKDVLDPRPDSETLINSVLDKIPDPNADLKILELGVGSGCMILTLLSERPNAQGVGVDISPEALVVSKKNADTLAVSDRLDLVQSDMFEKVTGKFDVIISNPPYIPTLDIEKLDRDVKNYDPVQALDGGTTGLDFYKKISNHFTDFLKPGGFLALEIGQGQAPDIIEMLKPHDVKVYKDLSGIERCLLVGV